MTEKSGKKFIRGIIILALVVAFLMGLGWFLGKKNKENRLDETADKPAGEPFFISENTWKEEPAAVSVPHQVMVDSETVDAKYARYNHMWVCSYCETLNRCLPGDNMFMPVQETAAVSQPALRGNLLKKRTAEQVNKGQPECIACGKQRIRRI